MRRSRTCSPTTRSGGAARLALLGQAIRAIVQAAGYDDPEAVEYLANTLIRRRDIVARQWLNGVNPIVDVSLSPSGALTFSNAAVDARVATHGTYTIAWAPFDNDSGATERVAVEKQTEPRGTAPAVLLSTADYIAATIWSEHPDTRAGRAGPGLLQARRRGVEDRRTLSKTIGLIGESSSTR